MDDISYVETLRVRLTLRQRGVRMEDSKADCSPDRVRELNWSLFSGQRALQTARDFTDLLLAEAELADLTGVGFADLFRLVLRSMCDCHRRTFYLSQRVSFQLLSVFSMDETSACDFIKGLWRKYQHRSCCVDPQFSQVVFAFTQYGADAEKVRALQQLVRDALIQFPASSVTVEKLHANVQLNCYTRHGSGRGPGVVQQNSYIMSTFLEHNRGRAAVEDETLGRDRRSAGALLRSRAAGQSSSLPCKASTRLKATTSQTRSKLQPLDPDAIFC